MSNPLEDAIYKISEQLNDPTVMKPVGPHRDWKVDPDTVVSDFDGVVAIEDPS